MELDITVSYLGAYQVYKLMHGEQIEATPPHEPVKGYRFLRVQPFPQHAVKRIRSFKVFPTIRDALIDACGYEEAFGAGFSWQEKFEHFTINEEIFEKEDLQFLNFI